MDNESSTLRTMSKSPSPAPTDSGENSSTSTRSASPMVSFDVPLDPSDPLHYLMNIGLDSQSGDSSTEDITFSTDTPPSSHGSPSADWSSTLGQMLDSKQPMSSDSQESASWANFPPFPFENLQPMLNEAAMNYDQRVSQLSVNEIPLQFDLSFFEDALLNAAQQVPLSHEPTIINLGEPVSENYSAGNLATGPRDTQLSSPSLSTTDSTVSSNASGSNFPSSPSSIASSYPSLQNRSHQVLPSLFGTQAMSAPDLTSMPQLSGNQMIDELAQRARQMVGVTMALPINFEGFQESNPQSAKLPIPRLQRPTPVPNNTVKRKGSTTNPPASSVLSSPVSPVSESPAPATTRTKTSHTTIERRYRTNLNSRIQSLRAAVPALRVLEHKEGNRVGNLPFKAGTRKGEPGTVGDCVDVVDERGYVDGVKVARKGSKANVLGKAVEYIQVLKRRELRLKREQEGLRTLIASLVGGPALLKEWESMWRSKFGGPETDELDPDEGQEADDEDEDDGDDADEPSDEGSGGKKRKRAKVVEVEKMKKETKVTPATNYPINSIPVLVGGQAEKRKRGRPRKVPLPTNMSAGSPQEAYNQIQPSVIVLSSEPQDVKMEDGISTIPTNDTEEVGPAGATQPQAQAPQVLLAAFAFFSFFNSPISFSASTSRTPSEHTHTGSVLGSQNDDGWTGVVTAGPLDKHFNWRDLIQLLHFIVSVLVLLSIIGPWLPRATHIRIKHLVPNFVRPLFGGVLSSPGDVTPPHSPTRSDDSRSSGDESDKDDIALRATLLSVLRCRGLNPDHEVQALREALSLGGGVFGLIFSVIRLFGSGRRYRSRTGLETRMLEQRAFLRLAELVALDANAPLAERIQTCLYAFKFLSLFSAPASDLSTLSLVVFPVWPAKANSLWAQARDRAHGRGSFGPYRTRAFESYILENISVSEAAAAIKKLDYFSVASRPRPSPYVLDDESDAEDDLRDFPRGPLAVLSGQSIREYVRVRTESVFLQNVLGDAVGAYEMKTDVDTSDKELRRVITAGRSLDGRTEELVTLLEKACSPTLAHVAHALDEDSDESEEETQKTLLDDADGEIRALLQAVLLYRRIFPSTLLSVPSGAATPEIPRTPGARPVSLPSTISISLTPMPSPPPSPSRKSAIFHYALREVLTSPAFDRTDALEDARDLVTDMLTAGNGIAGDEFTS